MSRTPIFIGGLMKSGTSLLRKLVARHRNVFGGLETHWFTPDMLDHWRDSSTQRQVWLRKFFDISDTEFAEIKAASKSGLDWFDRFMAVCTARAGKSRWVEKTPDNILHLDLIREGWPDAQVIHVVRDYRDVYASWKRNQTGSLEDFLAKTGSILAAIGDLAGTRNSTYLEVSYERLVVELPKTLRDVFDFLREPWADHLAAYDGDDSDHQRVLEVTGKASPTAMSLARPVFCSSVGQWREVLNSEESQSIQREFSEYFRLWGWS
jgi:hypothetical protein